MELSKLIERAKEIRTINRQLTLNEHSKEWRLGERMQGFVGDVGKLAQLIMAKNGYRKYPDLDKKLAHEMADCLWSILILADESGVDIEQAYLQTMDELEGRLSKKGNL